MKEDILNYVKLLDISDGDWIYKFIEYFSSFPDCEYKAGYLAGKVSSWNDSGSFNFTTEEFRDAILNVLDYTLK